MGTITMLTHSQVKTIVYDEVAPLLVADGFTPIDGVKFIRSAKLPIREVVFIGFGKSQCHLSSGWSLSFVPYVQGEKVRWQRTEKSIRVLDISCDPWFPWFYKAKFNQSDWEVDMFNDEATCRRETRTLTRKVVTHATDWWNRINSVADIIDLVLSLRKAGDRYIYPRQLLTLAFAYAYTGRREEARNAFDQCSHFWDDRGVRAALSKALDTTASSASDQLNRETP
jgi:hypothetical protein